MLTKIYRAMCCTILFTAWTREPPLPFLIPRYGAAFGGLSLTFKGKA